MQLKEEEKSWLNHFLKVEIFTLDGTQNDLKKTHALHKSLKNILVVYFEYK